MQIFVLIFFFFSLFKTIEEFENLKKINAVNLLIPQIYENLDSRTIQYELTAYNGCYEWASSHPNYLSIKGYPDEKNPNCQSKSTVFLNSNKQFKNIIWITAKDKGKILF